MIFKRCVYTVVIIAVAVVVLTSCNGKTANVAPPPPQNVEQPSEQPLSFSKPQKLHWNGIKPVTVIPVVKKLNINDLPSHSYDTALFKPFAHPIAEAKFDYNSLPSKSLDIDKLPSRPLKYKTYILPPPKVIKTGPPQIKDQATPDIYTLGDLQGIQGTINNIVSDNDGFLWIITTSYLYRYDGETLLQYLSASGNNYYYVIADEQGRLWLNRYNAIEILDTKKSTITMMDIGTNNNGDFSIKMFEDRQNRIWVSHQNTGLIDIIDTKRETVRSIGPAQGLINKFCRDMAQDSKDRIWIPTLGAGVEIIDTKANKIKYLDKAHGLTGDTIPAITCDHNGVIWLNSLKGTNGVQAIDQQKGTIKTISEFAGTRYVSVLLNDEKGGIWVATSHGVRLLDTAKHLSRVFYTGNGLADNAIQNITIDKNGQVWIVTTKGVNIISHNPHIIAHINNSATTSLFEDDGGLIWQASPFNGINIINRANQTYRHFGYKEGLSTDSLESVKNIGGQIFIATNEGADIIDETKNTLTHIGLKQGLSYTLISVVFKDKDGRIWIGGGTTGVDVYDPKTNLLRHIDKANGFNDNNVVDITQDVLGRMWVSTFKGGISVIDVAAGTIKYLNNVQGLNGYPKSFAKDNYGNIWISSEKGIFAVDIKNDKLVNVSLVHGTVSTILKQGGNIYAADNVGVSKITPLDASPGHFGKIKVELYGRGINRVNAAFFQTDAVSRDGSYLWGDMGVTVLDLSRKKIQKPNVYVSGISVQDIPQYFVDKSRYNLRSTDTLWDQEGGTFITGADQSATIDLLKNKQSYDDVSGSYNMPVNLSLPYDQNYLHFTYTSEGGPIQADSAFYKYKLEGVDTGWSAVTTATSSHTYYGLAPGRYTFVVTRSTENEWGKPATFSFVISPPWWQSWWAWLIYAGLFGGTVWCLVYYRSKQLVKTNKILEHKIHLRTEEVMQQKEEIEAQRDHLEDAVKELRLTQSQLVQSEKLASLGELTAGIAHEIQNPLNFVNNFSEVNMELAEELKSELKSGNTDEAILLADNIEQNMEKIIHHGKRADGIVKSMLQHSRNNHGEKQLTDINVLADEYFRLSYHGLRAKDKSFNSEMSTDFGKAIPKLNVVQQDVGRVLLNLFNNAFYAVQQRKKAGEDGYKPEVKVSTEVKGKFVEIRVKDNGTGIPETVKEKIMQPFFTTKPTGEGTGLGLSLSHDIVVKGHEGKIEVNSKENEFTEFVISLPVV